MWGNVVGGRQREGKPSQSSSVFELGSCSCSLEPSSPCCSCGSLPQLLQVWTQISIHHQGWLWLPFQTSPPSLFGALTLLCFLHSSCRHLLVYLLLTPTEIQAPRRQTQFIHSWICTTCSGAQNAIDVSEMGKMNESIEDIKNQSMRIPQHGAQFPLKYHRMIKSLPFFL